MLFRSSLTSGLVIVALTGHANRKMLAHYFHIRREARRGASGAVAQAPSPMEIPADVHQNGARALALRGTTSASRWVCLVGLGGVELPTFPIYRDAPANCSIQA